MKIENYEDMRDFIVSLEQQFPVDEWICNEIHIWPIIRIRLMFYLIDKILSDKQSNGSEPKYHQSRKSIFNRIKQWRLLKPVKFIKSALMLFLRSLKHPYFFIQYKKWLKGLKSKNNLFVGNKHFRTALNGSLFNRYFDTLIERDNLASESAVLEYGYDEREVKIAFSELSINHSTGLALFYKSFLFQYKNFRKLNFNVAGYEDFLHLLKSLCITKEFAIQHQNLENSFSALPQYDYFYRQILSALKPKQIYILCYYAEPIMYLISIANRKKIKIIEMQHGPMAELHLAYGSWTKIPKEGYNTIPQNFWCWDQDSAFNIERHLGRNKIYHAFVGGHPWVEYWQENIKKDLNQEKFVLYALQCGPFPLKEFFHSNILEIIKDSEFPWYLRLHPRQEINEAELTDYIKDFGISNKVVIDKANSKHLPELLASCQYVVTFTSGVTIEASLFNKKAILFSEDGSFYYSSLIEKGEAFYIDYKSDYAVERFNNLLKNNIQL